MRRLAIVLSLLLLTAALPAAPPTPRSARARPAARVLQAAQAAAGRQARRADLGAQADRRGGAQGRRRQPAAALPLDRRDGQGGRGVGDASRSRRARRRRAAGRSISWAHGTTGIADQCAPSRDGSNARSVSYAYPLLQRWLKAGYAVVRTDYEGLGTPGDHPYLIGRSEGHSVLDAVRAARKLDKRLGKRVVIAGHSQGGQSALWAASLAPKYTPDLKLRGTVAFAPVSHLAEQTRAAAGPALAQRPERPGGDDPARHRHRRARRSACPGMLSDRAAALYPQTLTACLGQLTSPSSFGGARAGRPVPPGRRPEPARGRAVPARRPGGPEDPHAGADPAGDGRPDRVQDCSPTRSSTTTRSAGSR